MQANRANGLFSVLLIALMILGSSPAQASTSSQIQQLKSQQHALQLEAEAKQQQAQQAAHDAAVLASQVVSLGQSLNNTQQQLNETSRQIDTVNNTISDKQAKIAKTKLEIAEQTQNQNEVLRTMYESETIDPMLSAITSSSISDVVSQQQSFSALEQSVELTIGNLTAMQQQLSQEESALTEQQSVLTQLKVEQQNQQALLTSQKAQASAQKSQAVAEQQSSSTQAAQLENEIASIKKKLSVLTATARWGTDIISTSSPASWSYIQLDYFNHLGSSPYTIHDYGCLVTSLAMLATYYHHNTTPPEIASHSNFFTRGGDAYTSTIVDSLGLVIEQQGPVDWLKVDEALAANHPVILSVYLPQVGALNSDGSSHFIVASARAGDQYVMQDPLGSGRGYGFGQVRSMIILRP